MIELRRVSVFNNLFEHEIAWVKLNPSYPERFQLHARVTFSVTWYPVTWLVTWCLASRTYRICLDAGYTCYLSKSSGSSANHAQESKTKKTVKKAQQTTKLKELSKKFSTIVTKKQVKLRRGQDLLSQEEPNLEKGCFVHGSCSQRKRRKIIHEIF